MTSKLLIAFVVLGCLAVVISSRRPEGSGNDSSEEMQQRTNSSRFGDRRPGKYREGASRFSQNQEGGGRGDCSKRGGNQDNQNDEIEQNLGSRLKSKRVGDRQRGGQKKSASVKENADKKEKKSKPTKLNKKTKTKTTKKQ